MTEEPQAPQETPEEPQPEAQPAAEPQQEQTTEEAPPQISEEEIKEGDEVVVTGVSGATLIVKKNEGGN